MEEIVAQWRKLVGALKDWPWPTFLAIAIAGGAWGWVLYTDAVKRNEQHQQQTVDAQNETIAAQKKTIQVQDKALNQSYSKDTTKH